MLQKSTWSLPRREVTLCFFWLDSGRLACSCCLQVTKHQGELQPAGIQLDFVAG
jgi:hypothetical protein